MPLLRRRGKTGGNKGRVLRALHEMRSADVEHRGRHGAESPAPMELKTGLKHMAQIVYAATIPGEPRTKKNSQMIARNGARRILLQSAAYRAYETHSIYIIHNKTDIDELTIIDYPVNVECVYYRSNRRRVDLVNLEEATLDVLVKAGVLKDDCFTIVQSMDGSRVEIDKENPRVEITITEA